VRSPNAVRRLLKKPRLMTLFELYAEQELDLVGGSPLEAANRWDHTKGLRTGRAFSKMRLIKGMWPFLANRTQKADDLPGYDRSVAQHYAGGRNDKDLIAFHYDVSNAFYALFLDPEMVYSSAYFPRFDASARRGPADQARPHLPQAATQARRPAARHRQRLGRACLPRRETFRRDRARRHPVRAPARMVQRQNRPRGSWRPRARWSCATTARSRRKQQYDADRTDRDVRASSASTITIATSSTCAS
jgi:hypothetical protein